MTDTARNDVSAEQRRRDRRQLERWLAAESAGRSEDSEAALGALFSRLDRLEPAPGFAERVLGALLAEPLAVGSGPAKARRWPAVGLAALLSGWLVLSLLAGRLAAPAKSFVSVAELLDGIGRALDWTARGLASAGELWSSLTGMANAFATAAGTLPVAVALLAGLAVAGLALRALSDLMARERSWSHVHFGG